MRGRFCKSGKLTAGIISVMMLLFVLLSSFYIAAEANHDCAGHDCPVCACVQQCEDSLHRVFDGLTAQAAAFIPVVCCVLPALFTAPTFACETLVSKKIRLNN